MADKTRTEIVTEEIAAVKAQRGEEAYPQLFEKMLEQITTSLAMLVDNSADSET